MKKTEGDKTLVFIMKVRPNKHQVKQAMKQLCGTDVAMFRPDGEKKAYVRLALDYDTLAVANKIGVISTVRLVNSKCNFFFFTRKEVAYTYCWPK